MTASTSLHLVCSLVTLSLLLTSTGCVWRTADIDHVWGPTLVRIHQPPHGKAYLWQIHSTFPLVAEGGEHIGLTFGFLNRLSANPIENDNSSSLQWCSGLFITSCSTPSASDGWHWSFFHGKIIHHFSPEFYDRSILGASVGTGADGSHVTLGYSATTRHSPRDNAYYILCYGRENALQTRFAVAGNIAKFISFLNQEACQ